MLEVTAVVASLAAILLVGLSFSVSLTRMKVGTEIGLGTDSGLLRRIRAQGNFIEYVPLALIVLGLAEYRGASAVWLWSVAGLLIIGRGLHATGILSGSTPARAVGMLSTYGALLGGVAALNFG